jgi:5S rRNA maturation endonuclease (ribonuclease M5)
MLTPAERLDEILKLLDMLEDISAETPVIVEGMRDIEALRRMGITKNVVSMGKGLSIFTFCEGISRTHHEVVVLTDWDRKGGRLARALKEAFEANGVKVNDRIRAQLVMLSKKEVKDIESMPTFIGRLRALTNRQD